MILAEKYEILDKIGKGRFGVVYKGINIKNNRMVAIKVETLTTTHILKHETTLLKYLYDGGVRRIPIVYWFGIIHEHAFVVMSYYDSCLYDLYQQNDSKMSIEQTRQYMIQAIHLIDSIHRKQVLHRDIKPQNFMLKNGELCLIDFGLAIIREEKEEPVISGEQGIVGTPKYSSYFIHKGEPYQKRDDLISLGYIFIEWIGGNQCLPWNCNGGSPKSNEEYILLKSWEKIASVFSQISQEGTTFLNYLYEGNINKQNMRTLFGLQQDTLYA